MKNTILSIAILAAGLSMPNVFAQETLEAAGQVKAKDTTRSKFEKRMQEDYEYTKQRKIGGLEQEKENIVESEKFELKKRIEAIEDRLEKGEISTEKAKALKEEAAQRAAQNIDNKTAIVENQIALVKRDVSYSFKPYLGSYIALGLGNAHDQEGSFVLGIDYNAENRKLPYDKRTYSDMVFATGVGGTVGDGRTLGDSYKVWKSPTSEIGIALRTRLLKNSNTYRLVYGLSYQQQVYGLSDREYMVNNNGVTEIQPFPYKLKRSQFTVGNLVVPVMLELGPSVKKEYKDYFRYDTSSSFKVGIGGFAGVNVFAQQRLKYKVDGHYVVNKNRADYNVNKFVYGLQGYVGIGAMSIFAKYDLNPVFDSSAYRDHALSFGLRVDL